MKLEEIFAILRVEKPDEVEEALETELFEIKRSILSKPLLRLSLKSKLSRLAQLSQIAESQKLMRENTSVPFSYELVRSDEVLLLWEGYMKAKNQWKMAFTQAQNVEYCMVLIEEGLSMERAFSEQFEDLNWTDQEPVFGVEPDPMLVQSGLKQAFQEGLKTFADLEKNKDKLGKDLLLALKRLSLLSKYL